MGLKSADAAYVLAFSVIMLNTDLHNNQARPPCPPRTWRSAVTRRQPGRDVLQWGPGIRRRTAMHRQEAPGPLRPPRVCAAQHSAPLPGRIT